MPLRPSRRQALRAAGTALAAGLAGCVTGGIHSGGTPADPVEGAWPMAGHDPGHAGHADAAGPGRAAGVRWQFEPGDDVNYLEPVVADGTVFVEGNKRLWRLEAATGDRLHDGVWAHAGDLIEVGGESATPAVVDGTCYVTGGGRAFAIDVPSGETVWEVAVASRVVGSLGRPGADRWHAVRVPGGATFAATSGPPPTTPVTVADGRVILGVSFRSDGVVLAIDGASGDVVWSVSTTAGERTAPVRTPAVHDDLVLFGTGANRVDAVDAATGERAWTFDPDLEGPTPRVAVADGTAFALSDGIQALDATTGEPLWRFADRRLGASNEPPAIGDGRLYAGSPRGHLLAVDAATGEGRWAYDAGSPVDGRPVVGGDTVYVGTGFRGRIPGSGPALRAIDAATGEERWTFGDEYVVQTAPAVVDGLLFVGADTLDRGVLFALGGEG